MIAITPRIKVSGQLVKITLMDRGKVQNGVKTILVKSHLSWAIEPDAGESGTEGNGMSDGGHDEQRERKKS
jgi:hypothetical protein